MERIIPNMERIEPNMERRVPRIIRARLFVLFATLSFEVINMVFVKANAGPDVVEYVEEIYGEKNLPHSTKWEETMSLVWLYRTRLINLVACLILWEWEAFGLQSGWKWYMQRLVVIIRAFHWCGEFPGIFLKVIGVFLIPFTYVLQLLLRGFALLCNFELPDLFTLLNFELRDLFTILFHLLDYFINNFKAFSIIQGTWWEMQTFGRLGLFASISKWFLNFAARGRVKISRIGRRLFLFGKGIGRLYWRLSTFFKNYKKSDSSGYLESARKWFADVLDTPESAFLRSCEGGDKAAMRSLLAKHAGALNVNLVRNSSGDTGLHLACRAGHAVVADSLLSVKEKVVNVNIENFKGETPLMIAAGAGHLAIVRRLARVKGIRLKENCGDRVIWNAVENGHYEVAHLLLTTLASKNIFVDPNLEPCLKRCMALSKEAKSTKSEPEMKKISGTLDIYRKSLKGILIPSETRVAPEKKTIKQSIEDLKEFLECTICFDEFSNLRVYSCVNDHWICEKCLPQNQSCPFCRIEFCIYPPKRCITSEKFLRIVLTMRDGE